MEARDVDLDALERLARAANDEKRYLVTIYGDVLLALIARVRRGEGERDELRGLLGLPDYEKAVPGFYEEQPHKHAAGHCPHCNTTPRIAALLQRAEQAEAALARGQRVVNAARALMATAGPWHGDGTTARVRAADELERALDALALASDGAERGSPPEPRPEGRAPSEGGG